MKFVTESGSEYQLALEDDHKPRVRRVPNTESSQLTLMRRDQEWLELRLASKIEIGQPVIMWIEPLGEGAVTIRTTTPVVSIDYGE